MIQENTCTSRSTHTYAMVTTAFMAAVTCILAPLSIPIGPVPISLTNLAIYLSLYLLNWKRGTISYCLYLLIGLAGLPVFSGFSGGIGKLAGPTGGYIIGFIPMAIIAGIIIDHFRNAGSASGNDHWYRCLLCIWHGMVLHAGRIYSICSTCRMCDPLYPGRSDQDGHCPDHWTGNPSKNRDCYSLIPVFVV